MFSTFFPQVIDDSRLDTYLNFLSAIKMHPEMKARFRPGLQISPAGFAILSCLTDMALEQKCLIRWPSTKIPVFIRQLQSITAHAGGLPDPQAYNYETADLVSTGNGPALNMGFIEKIQYKFGLSEDLIFDVKLILQELMQNTLAHSGAERYFAYAGLWESEIHCGILDMGVTIPAKLAQKYEFPDDIAYLEWAMQEGSTTRRMRTGGLGLFYFREFLKRNGAKLTIASGNAQVRHYFRTRKSQKSFLKHTLPGTWCFARLPLD